MTHRAYELESSRVEREKSNSERDTRRDTNTWARRRRDRYGRDAKRIKRVQKLPQQGKRIDSEDPGNIVATHSLLICVSLFHTLCLSCSISIYTVISCLLGAYYFGQRSSDHSCPVSLFHRLLENTHLIFVSPFYSQ